MKQAKHRIVTLIVILIIVATALLLTNFSPLGNTNVAGMASMSITGMTAYPILEGSDPWEWSGTSSMKSGIAGYTYVPYDAVYTNAAGEDVRIYAGQTVLWRPDGTIASVNPVDEPGEVFERMRSGAETHDQEISVYKSGGWTTPINPSGDTSSYLEIFTDPSSGSAVTTSGGGGPPPATTPTPGATSSFEEKTLSDLDSGYTTGDSEISYRTNTGKVLPITVTPDTKVAKVDGSFAISEDGGSTWKVPINDGDEFYVVNPSTGLVTAVYHTDGTATELDTPLSPSTLDAKYAPPGGGALDTEGMKAEGSTVHATAGPGTSGTPTTADVSEYRSKLYRDLGLDPTAHSTQINQINALIEGGAFIGGNDEVLRILGGGNINELDNLINEMQVMNGFTSPDYSVTMGGNVIASNCGSNSMGCTTIDDNLAVGYPNPSGEGVVYVTQDKKWYQGQGKAKYYYYDPVTGERKAYDSDLINTEDYTASSRQDLREAENQFREDLPEMDFDGVDGPDGKQLSILQEQQYFQTYNQIHSANMNQLVGYLNGALTKKLGPKLAEVPSRFCRNMLHVGDFPEDSWLNIPHNTTPAGLQYALTKGIRTVNIDGEKEEITPEMYRYAYTVRILADQYVAWETYLYNSCTEEDSKEIFYDYGSVSMGEYFMYHYAGSAGEDMIFEYGTDPVYIFDTACVKVVDEEGEEEFCTPLTNGNGFITPSPGTDYDCYLAVGAATVY